MVDAKRLYEVYKDTDFFTKIYVKIKLKICPLLALEKYLPQGGKILDIGCGFGLLSNIIALGANERIVRGIDLSESKICIAKKTVGNRENLSFSVKSIYDLQGTEYDAIVIADVLYLIPFERQEEILRNCFRRLNKNGLLIVKEINTRPYWKYLLNLFQETLSVKILRFTLTQGNRFFFRNSLEYKELLSRIGFEVDVIRLDEKQIHSHIVYICRKETDQELNVEK